MRYATYLLAGAALFVSLMSLGYTQTKAAAPAADAQQGKDLYMRYGCVQCHGTEGQGGGNASRLGPNPLPLKAFIAYVRAPRGVMPAYTEKALKSERELADIHAYLSTRAKPASPDVLKALGIAE